jgi:hypothetical protein
MADAASGTSIYSAVKGVLNMASGMGFEKLRNLLLIIFAALAALLAILYFVLPGDISLAVIISSVLAFAAFAATLFYYRWIFLKKAGKAIKFAIAAFAVKIIFLGCTFYLAARLEMINIMAFAVSFIVFFTIFLYIELFVVYRKMLFK